MKKASHRALPPPISEDRNPHIPEYRAYLANPFAERALLVPQTPCCRDEVELARHPSMSEGLVLFVKHSVEGGLRLIIRPRIFIRILPHEV